MSGLLRGCIGTVASLELVGCPGQTRSAKSFVTLAADVPMSIDMHLVGFDLFSHMS